MSYSLTEKQKEGLEICIKRYKENKPYTAITRAIHKVIVLM